MRNRIVLTVLLVLAPATSLQAQRRDVAFATQDTTQDVRFSLRPMRVAKWATLLASAGAAGYGFAQNRVADRDYQELERVCEGNPSLCQRKPNQQYVDAAMESRYQEIVDRDDRARYALLAGQIGIAASVVMFIIDLPNRSDAPEDIPYEPKPIRFGLRSDGGVNLQFNLRTAGF